MRATSTKPRALPASSCCAATATASTSCSRRWETKEAFSAWVNSDLFKMSHRHANGELAHSSEVRNYDVIDTRVAA